MSQKIKKNQIDHYQGMQAFFDDADRVRKNVVKCRLKGMTHDHMANYSHTLGSFGGFTLSDRLVHDLWAHYNGGVK